jgi:UDP-N-acetyl-D-mannosaminuronate dehydrogenase
MLRPLRSRVFVCAGGGHCIHVNVRHLPAKQREHGISTKLIEFGDRQGTWRGYEL